MADPQAIVVCLQNTFSASNQARQAAEQQLKQFETTHGFALSLLKIAGSNEADLQIRQSSSILFKKLTRANWEKVTLEDANEEEEGGGEVAQEVVLKEQVVFVLSEEEKTVIKQNIIEVLIHAPPKVRSQLGVALRNIVACDFPRKWTDLVSKLMTYITSKDLPTTAGALEALRITVKKYEYVAPGSGKRKELYQLVDVTLPTVLQLFQGLASLHSLESAQMQITIVKIFHSVINLGIPPFLQNPNNIFPWLQLLLQLLQQAVPENVVNNNSDDDEKAKNPFWKCKQWISKVFTRMYQRYGDPKLCDTPDGKMFAKQFSSQFAPKLLESFLHLLNVRRSGNYLPDALANSALSFLNTTLHRQNMYQLIKPLMNDYLFKEVVFPYLCFSAKDYALWKEDPHEYLRKEFDIIQEFASPKQAALNLTVDLCKVRGKEHLTPLMTFIAGILIKYANSPAEQRQPQQKEGALLVVGAIADKLIKTEGFKSQLEPLLRDHVLPEMKNTLVPFLRSRAAWTFSQFFDLEFSDRNIFLEGLRCVIQQLRDPELPVRVSAAQAFRNIVASPLSDEPVKQLLPSLLEDLFNLMNEIDNDELVAAVEVLVEKFGPEMGPYAVALCGRLSQTFLKIITNEDEEESAMAAMECLMAIQTILDCISNTPEMYPQVEQVLIPLIDQLLTQDHIDFIEETIKIISFITYYSPTISPQMWEFFNRLYSAFSWFGLDLITEVLIPFDNYISRGTETFLAGPYPQMIFQLYQKILMDPKTLDEIAGDAAKLAEVVLLNCKGRVDNFLGGYLECAVHRLLNKSKKTSLKVLLLEVVSHCLYYNVGATLQLMESKGWTQPVFGVWFTQINKFSRTHDKKVAILGLSSLLTVPAANLPGVIRAGMKSILEGLVTLMHELDVQKKEEAEREDKDSDDEDDYDDEDEEIDDEKENEDDNETLQELAQKAHAYYEDLKDDDVEDEANNDEDELEEEEDFTSPLDNVDEVIVFTDYIKAFAAQNEQFYHGLLSSLDQKTQEGYKALFELAEKRKLEKLQQQQP